jgi:hypothetical protein
MHRWPACADADDGSNVSGSEYLAPSGFVEGSDSAGRDEATLVGHDPRLRH